MLSKKNSQSERAVGCLHWCWLSIIVILLDQASKYLALAWLIPYQANSVWPFFNFTLMFNRGAAFGFLSRSGAFATWLFAAVAVVMSSLILYWLNKLPRDQRWTACALALILGGALGNFLDRIARHQVIDFLDFYFGAWHFPAFNLADTAISVGAIMLFIGILTTRKIR
jgi:signal peptidase II